MKSGWVTKKLGEVCEITAGNSAPQGSDNFSESGDRCFLRVADMGQLHGMTIGSTRDRLSDKPKGLRLFPSGSVVFTKSGASLLLNQRGVLARPMHVVSHIGVLIPSNEISSEYLYYWMCIVDFGRLVKPAHMPALRLSQVANLDISIPPLAEQKRIVAKIDAAFEKIDALKANAEKNLANAKELFQSALDEAMRPKPGWVEKRLPDISVNNDSKRVPITKSKRKPGTFPYYGASGIVDYVDDYIFDGSYLLVSEDGANLESRTYPIAFSISGKSWVNNHAHILKFEDADTQAYVELYLNSFSLNGYITGAAQPKLTQDNLNKIPINIPVSSSEIAKLVKQLKLMQNKTDALQQNYSQQIADCAEMRQAILREAFEGRL